MIADPQIYANQPPQVNAILNNGEKKKKKRKKNILNILSRKVI